ncbi:uncharacterized protein LOC111243169 isoform X4 [Varroa destructor]|uniref:Uncharacterized protein n=1 Tax=Varroa destructor TaxID=109461 RepID=A0A7M7IZY9_VARDE|nr:uncharacterized protein LOC111243169 isoform X4 [Varroa destructor]
MASVSKDNVVQAGCDNRNSTCKGDDDQDKNCDEKTDVSVEVLEDRIAVLACKMEKHAEQEQEACTLIIENAKLLSKLQQYRSVRATNERLELAGLIRRSRELEKVISSEQEKNEQLEKEIEYEKNLLRRLIESTLDEINERHKNAIELLREQEGHERCEEKLAQFRQSREKKLHELNAEIASYKEDIKGLRIQLKELDSKRKRRKFPPGRGNGSQSSERARGTHIDSKQQEENSVKVDVEMLQRKPCASWDQGDPLLVERKSLIEKEGTSIEISSSENKLSPTEGVDGGNAVDTGILSQTECDTSGENGASSIWLDAQTVPIDIIQPIQNTREVESILEQGAAGDMEIGNTAELTSQQANPRADDIKVLANPTEPRDVSIDDVDCSEAAPFTRPAKRKALFHDPDPVISYVPPLKTSKGGASDDEDRRVKEYLEGLWSLVQKSASKRTSCRPSDGSRLRR